MKLKLEKRGARIELIALIDIIFLLLVFFIYSMLSMAVYRGIPVTLPSAETVESTKEQALFITIDDKGNIFVDKELVKDDLMSRLTREQEAFPQKVAIISGDGDSPYRVFVDVLDKVRLAGFKRVSMEARPRATQQP